MSFVDADSTRSSPPPQSAHGMEPSDGVDVTLIRWTLSLTPRERLEVLQANADALARFQNVGVSKR